MIFLLLLLFMASAKCWDLLGRRDGSRKNVQVQGRRATLMRNDLCWLDNWVMASSKRQVLWDVPRVCGS